MCFWPYILVTYWKVAFVDIYIIIIYNNNNIYIERERKSKTWIEGYRANKNNNFPTSFGRGLLQGNFLKFWVWQKLHDVRYVLFHYDVTSDITTDLL